MIFVVIFNFRPLLGRYLCVLLKWYVFNTHVCFTEVYFVAVTCPELDISSYEGVRFTKLNDTVIFSCDPGLVLAGNTSMECLIDGSWTGYIPACVKPGA